MILLVDKNEESNNPKVFSQLKKCFSQVMSVNLPHHSYGGTSITSGDINIPLDDGSLLAIERKTPEDFLNSIPERHIFNQVETMAKYAKYSVIIMTGKFLFGKNDMTYIGDRKDEEPILTKWNGASVRSVICSIQFSGCPVIFCPPAEFCNQISEIYNLVNQDSKHQSIVKNRIITFPPIDDRIQFIAQLPGVGMKLANSILKFAGMMNGDTDEEGYGTLVSALHYISIMLTIDKGSRPVGWGIAKVQTVRKFFGLESDEYLAHPKEIEVTDYDGSQQGALEIDQCLYVKVGRNKITKEKNKIIIAPF